MRRPLRVAIAGVVGLAGLAIAVPALAATNQVIAQTGGAEAQITLLGVPVTVSVELNTDTGDITAVNVTPPGDLVATKDTPSRVRFESANGQTSVSVKAKKDSLSIGARTASLKDLVGSNTWKSSVFGAGDGPSSVAYTIADDGSGGPVLTLGAIAPGTGVTANSLGTSNGGGDDDEGMTASGSVEFTKDGFRKVLTIRVRVRKGDDDDNASAGSASLSITLRGRNVQRKALADLAGAHVWDGVLCDGTKASINYTVDATTGAVAVTSTNPADATTKDSKNGVAVVFPAGTVVSIRVKTAESATANAALAINVSGSKHCNNPVPSVDPPKVNTPVSTQAPETNTGGNGKRRGGGNNGNGNGRNNGGGDNGNGQKD